MAGTKRWAQSGIKIPPAAGHCDFADCSFFSLCINNPHDFFEQATTALFSRVVEFFNGQKIWVGFEKGMAKNLLFLAGGKVRVITTILLSRDSIAWYNF
jgi:hypothetical protein